jgi:hypothetical protein
MEQHLEGELDVQWVANIVPEDGHPTPAAGDTAQPGDVWFNVPDPNFGDAEDINTEDGDPVD